MGANTVVPRCNRSYRDVEDFLAKRGVEVDHVSMYRWAPSFTPAARQRGPLPPP